jgi:branched-subunit amino acid ABC-type transport system permease component
MQILLNGLITGSAYALLAIGFTLQYATVRYFNLTYGIVGTLGAYMAFVLNEYAGWPLPIALLGAGIFALLLGLLSYFGLFKIMIKRHCSNVVILVASFGLLIVLENITGLIFGYTSRAISFSSEIVKGLEFFDLIITPAQVVIALTALVTMLALEIFLQKTKFGMAIRAIGDNHELTTVLGLQTEKIVIAVFMLTSFIAGIGAALSGMEVSIRIGLGVALLIKAYISAIVGGLGSIRGAVVGAMILGIAENITIYFTSSAWQDVIGFLLLTLILMFRPQGLFAKQKLVNV